MDFESLIPILFVIVWILSVVFGKKKKKGKKDSPLKGVIGNLLKQVKAELEKNSARAKGDSGWDVLVGDGAAQSEAAPPFPLDVDTDSLPDPDPDFYSGPDRQLAPPPIPALQKQSQKPTLPPIAAGKMASVPTRGKAAGTTVAIDLEKAVIWSEILAPPVAFRKEHLSDRWC